LEGRLVLLLRRKEAEGLLDLEQAIQATRAAVLEEVAGSVVRMQPFGGQGWSRSIVRVVGGGLFGLGMFGVRAGPLALVFDADSSKPLAIMDLPTGDIRLSASVALGAQYLARPDAHRVALVGSGGVANAVLRGLCAVRPIDTVGVWSGTPEHRESFAARASQTYKVAATAHDTPDRMLAETDIVAVATNAHEPLVRFDQLRPGTHVTSSGLNFELDASVYTGANQLVATSRQQEIGDATPAYAPGRVTGGPIWDLLSSGALTNESIVELGAIVRGDVAARNGPSDINVYRESRGGVGDAALASRVYEIARERGLGTEVDFG